MTNIKTKLKKYYREGLDRERRADRERKKLKDSLVNIRDNCSLTHWVPWVIIRYISNKLILFGCVVIFNMTQIVLADNKVNEVQIEVDGYDYKYKLVPVVNPESKALMYYAGKITITNLANNSIVYEENNNLQPGMCDRFPVVSKLKIKNTDKKLYRNKKEHYLVVLCGSYSGRHKTLKVFLMSPRPLKVASLQMGNTRPNISDSDDDGVYESLVYRRIMFERDKKLGVIPYLFVYGLHVDSSTLGFYPLFTASAAHFYLDYYQKLSSKSESIHFDYMGPMIAALVSTQDVSLICTELSTLIKREVSMSVLIEWTNRVNKIGFPLFDLNKCKEN